MRHQASLIILLLTLIAAAACDDGASGPPPEDAADLTIPYIERLPHLEYVVNSTNPTRDGWPDPGDTVTWMAHVKKIGRAHV